MSQEESSDVYPRARQITLFFSSFKLALTLSPEVNLIAVGDNLHIWFPLAHPNSFLDSYLIYVST